MIKIEEEVYIERVSKYFIYYLKTQKSEKNRCDICGVEDKKTYSHHLIPSRCKPIDKILKSLRIRVCKICHENIHPENAPLRNDEVILRQSKEIQVLQDKLKIALNSGEDKFLVGLENQRKRLIHACKEVVENLPERKRHPALKQLEGRIKENKRIYRFFKSLKFEEI